MRGTFKLQQVFNGTWNWRISDWCESPHSELYEQTCVEACIKINMNAANTSVVQASTCYVPPIQMLTLADQWPEPHLLFYTQLVDESLRKWFLQNTVQLRQPPVALCCNFIQTTKTLNSYVGNSGLRSTKMTPPCRSPSWTESQICLI